MAVATTITLPHRIESWAYNAYQRHYAQKSLPRASNDGANFMHRLGPLLPAHKTALRNLRLAFPGENQAWHQDVAMAAWSELGRIAGEFSHLRELNCYTPNSAIEVHGLERLDAIKASPKGAVFISGHFSNWELMPAAIAQRGLACQMTYRPANNPLIDAAIQKNRSHYGATMQAAKGKEGGMGLLRALAKGQSVALMNDQKYNEGLPAPLFGHDCMTADGPTRLALRYGVPLVPFGLRRTAAGPHFLLTIHPEIPLDRESPLEVAAPKAVHAINAFMEARIREAPEQWFWVHRRWPKEAWAKAGVL
jgi:Kdo2-lipid IVA lauroyltransferase/acyltransferase